MGSTYPNTYRGSRAVPMRYLTASDFRSAAASSYLAVNQNAVSASTLLRVIRGMLRIGGRMLPYTAAAITAWDLWEFYKWYKFANSLSDIQGEYLGQISRPEKYDATHYVELPIAITAGWEALSGFTDAYPTWLGAYAPPINLGYSAQNGGFYTSYPRGSDYSLFYADLATQAWVGGSHMYLCHNFVSQTNNVPGYPGFYGMSAVVQHFYHPAPEGLPYIPGKLVPASLPSVLPSPVYPPLPALDPLAVPALAPMVVSRPIPYWMLPNLVRNPYRYELYQRNSGYGKPELKPYEIAYAAPPIAIGSLKALANMPPFPKAHSLRKPPRNVKERKVRLSGYLAVNLFVGNLTEALDMLNVIYEALPRNVRPFRYVSQTERLKIIYDNFEQLDLEKAVEGLVKNELQDRLFGSIGNTLKDFSATVRPHGELPIGFMAGKAL